MIVVAPTVTEDGLPAVVERVSDLIEAQDGAIESFTHDSPWGHRRLAYPIQNFRDAFYVLFYFHAVPRAISELDRELRLDNVIIRHLIVKFDPLAYRHAGDDEDYEDGEDEAPLAAEAAEEAAPEADEAAEAGGDADDVEDDDDTEDVDDADEDDEDDDADGEAAVAEDDDDESDADGDENDDADDGEDDEKE